MGGSRIMVKKYAIGIDYGTESGRVVMVSLDNGEEVAEHVTAYQHGVIDKALPYSELELGKEWSLQHADDYLNVLQNSIPYVLEQSGVDSADIVGVGVAFTSCTMLPVDKNNQPLMFDHKWKDHPHSWVKLWKHHSAQDKANRIKDLALQRDEHFIKCYGGEISSEWMLPKIVEMLHEDPDLYEAADKFVEASDWIISQLTGKLTRNSCAAGYKSLWSRSNGYPSREFFQSIDPRLGKVMETKLAGDIVPQGVKVGEITRNMAKLTGLTAGTAVASGNIDAHASFPAASVTVPGKLVMVMGTSVCHLTISRKEKYICGISGCVEDGLLPGFYGYEAGQPAMGDIFAWFTKQFVSEEYKIAAAKEGLNIYQYLEKKALCYRPGESGLLALDWWNGNRSILNDAKLSGLILGITVQTKPEEIYRSLLEATAFGSRTIVENFRNNGIDIDEIYTCGGLPHKNKLLLQIIADVTNLPVKVAATRNASGLGAAMYGAVAAGSTNGGFDHIIEAAQNLTTIENETIYPVLENVEVYNRIYKEYVTLYNYFGCGENNVMKHLKSIRDSQK